jgi:hypothetical protein
MSSGFFFPVRIEDLNRNQVFSAGRNVLIAVLCSSFLLLLGVPN